jgi:hypothetical protein
MSDGKIFSDMQREISRQHMQRRRDLMDAIPRVYTGGPTLEPGFVPEKCGVNSLHDALNEQLYRNDELRLLPGPLHPRCPDHPEETWQGPNDAWRVCAAKNCKWGWKPGALMPAKSPDAVHFPNERVYRYSEDDFESDFRQSIAESTKEYAPDTSRMLQHIPGTDLRGAALMSSAHPGDGAIDSDLNDEALDVVEQEIADDLLQKVEEDATSRQEWIEIYRAGLELLSIHLEDNKPDPDILDITRDIARGD